MPYYSLYNEYRFLLLMKVYILGYRALAFTIIRKDFYVQEYPYPLRALVLGTLLAATSFGFASANTTTHAPATAVASTKVEAPTVASTQAVTINTAALM